MKYVSESKKNIEHKAKYKKSEDAGNGSRTTSRYTNSSKRVAKSKFENAQNLKNKVKSKLSNVQYLATQKLEETFIDTLSNVGDDADFSDTVGKSFSHAAGKALALKKQKTNLNKKYIEQVTGEAYTGKNILTKADIALIAANTVSAASGDEDLEKVTNTAEKIASVDKKIKLLKAKKQTKTVTEIQKEHAKKKAVKVAKAKRELELTKELSLRERVTVSAKRIIASTGTAFKSLAVLIAPAIAIFMIIILLVAVVLSLSYCSSNNAELTDVQNQVISYLRNIDFTDEAIAAVMGNIEAESDWNPNSDDSTGGGDSWGYLQYTNEEKYAYFGWCSANNKTRDDITSQLEWTFSNDGTHATVGCSYINGYFATRWLPDFAYTSYNCEPGWKSRFGRDFYLNGEEFKKADDVALAAYSWMACYERCGSGKMTNPKTGQKYPIGTSQLSRRIEAAERFYSAMQSGDDYASASAEGKAILDACNKVPSPGAGLCAMWVSFVYQEAGLGYPGGNANNMYWNYCTSSNKSDLKPGMIVAVSTHNGTAAGRVYGHVGIYIGNNTVMDNIGYIRTISLDEWISTYGDLVPVKWGWAL